MSILDRSCPSVRPVSICYLAECPGTTDTAPLLEGHLSAALSEESQQKAALNRATRRTHLPSVELSNRPPSNRTVALPANEA